MKEVNLTHEKLQQFNIAEDTNDSSVLTNFNEDSINIGDKNTELINDNSLELENEEKSNNEGPEKNFQVIPDSELNSDPYPDLVDELSGIIYISRIPPYMGLSKLRSYFSNFGKIGKIYAHPEPIGQYRKRVKMGGNKRLKFTHAWIQFYDKSIAKNVANLLNNKPFSDTKKSSFWKYDIWNIKYLPKFKWHHLVEYWSDHKRESKQQLNLLLQRERKRNLRYLEQLEIEKREHNIQLKKKSKLKSDAGTNITNTSATNTSSFTDNINSVKSAEDVKNVKLNKKVTHNKKRKKTKHIETSDKDLPLNLLNTIAM